MKTYKYKIVSIDEIATRKDAPGLLFIDKTAFENYLNEVAKEGWMYDDYISNVRLLILKKLVEGVSVVND